MKILFVLAAAVTVLAASPLAFKKDKSFVSFNHLALYVNDLKKSGDFYEKVVGLQVMEEPFKDGKHIWYKVGEHAQLHLIAGSGKEPRPDRNTHLCFAVADLQPVIEKLNGEKIVYSNWAGEKGKVSKRTDGVQQIYIQDPDGFWVEINDDKY